jgi:Carboxypeptidase regulatory-like domain/TonB dependent receptor
MQLSKFYRVFSLLLLLVTSFALKAQTFRGGVAGTVTDASGAVVPGAKLTLTGTDTGSTHTTESTSAGAYSFQDLPLGNYSLTVEAAGFAQNKIAGIAVQPGQVYSLAVKLSIASSAQQVEVNAAAIALDTESSTNNSVVGDQAVANIPLNGRDFTQLIKIVPGYNGAGSLNGTRTNQNNYQIDGADNNDIWQNASAANQGGVGSIAGVTLPIDAIDQFTVQSSGNAEAGRNGGGVISLALKTGTNKFHGTGYYFNRNEFFAARSPFLLPATRKATLRNQQFGGSLGGPIIKDKAFFFLNYERQKFVIGPSASTEPNAAYVQAATNLLTLHHIPVNPLSVSVLSLWPQGNSPNGLAQQNNYFDPHPQTGYSDNTVGNISYNLTSRQTLRLQSFIGTGRQYETVGTNVYPYYEVAPDITQNWAVTHNWAITDHISNQALAAVGVFNQTFNDAVHNQDIPALGLNTSVTNPALFGAPTISIDGGFIDTTGETQPLGRKDYTGHITDTATWVTGKHQFRFGGEFRRNYMDLQYQRNVRGTFSFNGTSSSNPAFALYLTSIGATSYTTDSTYGGADVRGMADYLAGFVASSSFTQGYLRRSIYQKTFSLFAQDQYQILPKLTLNYGLRYDYNAPFTSTGELSVYRPGAPGADLNGLVLSGGAGLPGVYKGNHTNIAPRFGFSAQATNKMVVRGTYGLYFDAPNFNGFFDNRPGNGAAVGLQANNTGPNPVFNVSPTFYQWQTNVAVFPTTPAGGAIFGVGTINPNFRTAYIENFGLNTEYQVSKNTLFTVAYVGSVGRRLFNLSDINQAAPGVPNTAAAELARRPIYLNKTVANYAQIGATNEIQSEGTSNYHSLQTTIRTSGFHGLTAQGSYTYGHALDVISSTRGLAPQDSTNLRGEYGNADFDVRHTFNGYVVYEAPQIGHSWPLLTKGWQGNAFVTAFTGTPFSVKVGTDNSGSGENQDRVNVVPGVAKKTTTGTSLIGGNATTVPYALLYNIAAFTAPAPGTFGTSARNLLRGPGFFTTDASLVKNTRIHEGVSLQLRAELFNIFNHVNLANPTASIASASFGKSTSTRNSGGAPGIGPGEPFNVQFAGKIIF